MRPALVTLFPMLAAALLVTVGGERLARRPTESRTPVDRERLLDFDEALRGELARLDALYDAHLGRLAEQAAYRKEEEVAAIAGDIAGIRLVKVFRDAGKGLTVTPGLDPPRHPEMVMRDGKRPLNPSFAVTLEPEWLGQPLPAGLAWQATPDPGLRLHLRQPEPGVLVAILIDPDRLRRRVGDHLAAWVESPLTPLREAGERTTIEAPDGTPLVSTGPDRHGPAAAILPVRTLIGTWQLKAWDGIRVSTSHDAGTLALASTLAVLLAISGVLLFEQQRRALRLAAERVSFVNRVSHELGTPLTNLALNLDLARDHLPHPPAEAGRRLDLVAEEIHRLGRLVANVLTFSRRERDTLRLRPVRCRPGEVVADTLESFRPSLERRGIEIVHEIRAAGPVLVDPDALAQITGNLLSNVEKYAASGRRLDLRCRLDEGQLTIEVRDRGPGIPESARERIFAAFERVHEGTNEGSSGTGLGLTIARDLARRMGGDLELVDVGAGSAFRLRVPAPPALAVLSPDAA